MLKTDLQYFVKDPEFTTQLQELTQHFCNIENEYIRQYAINLVKEVSKIANVEKAKSYCDDVLS